MALIFGDNTANNFVAPLDFGTTVPNPLDPADIVFSGAGDDTVDSSASVNNTIIFSGNDNDTITVGSGSKVFAGAGDDILTTVGSGQNRFYGGAGNDTFLLGDKDFAFGGVGDDALFVTSGEGTTLVGGDGIDQFWVVNGGAPTVPLTDLNVVADYNTTVASNAFPLPIVGDVIGIGAAGLITTDVTVTQDIAIATDTIVAVNGIDVARVKNVAATDLAVIDGAGVGFNDSILIISALQPPV